MGSIALLGLREHQQLKEPSIPVTVHSIRFLSIPETFLLLKYLFTCTFHRLKVIGRCEATLRHVLPHNFDPHGGASNTIG
jgi:hypothetical protein